METTSILLSFPDEGRSKDFFSLLIGLLIGANYFFFFYVRERKSCFMTIVFNMPLYFSGCERFFWKDCKKGQQRAKDR